MVRMLRPAESERFAGMMLLAAMRRLISCPSYFEIGLVNEREARESGLWLKAWVMQERPSR
jgi:hypothetical protein